jgi:hypothetical protein
MNCCSSALTRLRRRIVATLAVLASLAGLATPVAAGPTCHGQFMNPITDICWSCMFPLTLGSATLVSDGQPDISNPSSPVCFCSNPPRIGVAIGFWEPVRLVDVTRTPFCMVGLGGLAIDPGIEVPRGAQVGHDSQTRNSFYQVHWYANPILSWLEVLLDFPCLEKGPLDLAYLTEVDPLWADDELAAILNPEAVLFANVVAKAACAADCVAASAGMPFLADQSQPTAELQHRADRSPAHRGRAITADPQAIAGNIAGTYSGCAVQTVTTPDRFETAICHQYRTLETVTCDKVLIVTPIQTPGCSAGQFLTRVTADPCPACIDYLAFDFSCGTNSYTMHVFTLDKGSGQVYMDLGSQDVPGSLNTQIPQTPGPSRIDGFFCYQTYYSQSCAGPNCTIGAWFYNPCQGTSYYGANTFAMPTTVSFSDTWDNQCATLEARSQ